MREVEAIAELLKDCRLSVVSKATKISVATLTKIRDGNGGNPLHSTMQALNNYFDDRDNRTKAK